MGYEFGVEKQGFELSLNGERVRVIDASPKCHVVGLASLAGIDGGEGGVCERGLWGLHGDCGGQGFAGTACLPLHQ